MGRDPVPSPSTTCGDLKYRFPDASIPTLSAFMTLAASFRNERTTRDNIEDTVAQYRYFDLYVLSVLPAGRKEIFWGIYGTKHHVVCVVFAMKWHKQYPKAGLFQMIKMPGSDTSAL